MNICEQWSALLDAFIDGETTPAQAQQVREHLMECDACSDYVADAFAMRDQFPQVEDTPVPEAFADVVMAASRS